MTMLVFTPLKRRIEMGREPIAVLALRRTRRLLKRLARRVKRGRPDPFPLWRPLMK